MPKNLGSFWIWGFVLIQSYIISAAPTDIPIKVDLPVYENQDEYEALDPESSIGFGEAIYPGLGSGVLGQKLNVVSSVSQQKGSLVSSLLNHKLQAATHAVGQKLNSAANIAAAQHAAKTGLFAGQPPKLESALLDSEDPIKKAGSLKNVIQSVLAGIFQPKPVVDTLIEEEKYGNSGDKFHSAGRLLVGGAESISNLVNSALEVPFTVARQITKTASEKLNNLGGKLVGL